MFSGRFLQLRQEWFSSIARAETIPGRRSFSSSKLRRQSPTSTYIKFWTGQLIYDPPFEFEPYDWFMKIPKLTPYSPQQYTIPPRGRGYKAARRTIVSENLIALPSRVPEILMGKYKNKNRKIDLNRFSTREKLKLSSNSLPTLTHVKISAWNKYDNLFYVRLIFFVSLAVMPTQHTRNTNHTSAARSLMTSQNLV